MSVRVGFGIGPFYISGGGGRRRYVYGKHRRFRTTWYWLFGVFMLEFYFWLLAAQFLAIWWLLWATTAAILGEVSRYRELPAWWGSVMDSTRPVWPRRKSGPVKAWHPKPIH
jgi:hypothetical protein